MSAPTANVSDRGSRGQSLRKPLLYVIASAGMLVMAAPFLWMALSAFKTGTSPPARRCGSPRAGR
ncbi:hypothetical protein GCM10022206_25640 [Streptomyces chiangmaiensis]